MNNHMRQIPEVGARREDVGRRNGPIVQELERLKKAHDEETEEYRKQLVRSPICTRRHTIRSLPYATGCFGRRTAKGGKGKTAFGKDEAGGRSRFSCFERQNRGTRAAHPCSGCAFNSCFPKVLPQRLICYFVPQQAESDASIVWADPVRELVTLTPKEYERQIKAKTKAMNEAERQQGMTLDEIKIHFNKTKDALDKARKSVGDLAKLLSQLQRLHQERVDRWENFLTQISVRARMQFIKNLSSRNYAGKIKFNHESRKLSIQVCVTNKLGKCQSCLTDKLWQVQTDEGSGSYQKDARTLSGGWRLHILSSFDIVSHTVSSQAKNPSPPSLSF